MLIKCTHSGPLSAYRLPSPHPTPSTGCLQREVLQSVPLGNLIVRLPELRNNAVYRLNRLSPPVGGVAIISTMSCGMVTTDPTTVSET